MSGLFPGIGQMLTGRHGLGALLVAAAAGTLVLTMATQYEARRLHSEFVRLRMPEPFLHSLALDGKQSLQRLGGLYLGLGIFSALSLGPSRGGKAGGLSEEK